MNCPKCNSDQLESYSGDFATGVEMNGYHETFSDEFLECQQCGLRMDLDDALPAPLEWSITPTGEQFYYFV